MRILLIASLILGSGGLMNAQDFYGEAPLQKVERDGFYRVLLNPDLTGYANERFSNVRIYDQDNKEIPYLLKSEAPVSSSLQFKNYDIVEKDGIKDSVTYIVLRNSARNSINNISLQIKNADVSKEATLSGSDDQRNWYVLKQQFVLSNINNASNTSEIKIVDFPLSNYEFYAIKINDKGSAPLNILGAGYYSLETAHGQYSIVKVSKMKQSDSLRQKQSYLRISFDTPSFIDKLEWFVSGTPYYRRSASLYEERERLNRKKKVERYNEYITAFEMNSASFNSIQLPGRKAKDLVLVIENDDNPVLHVDSIRVYQLNRYVIAWFEKDKAYVLRAGKDSLRDPVYDLSFFQDSIPSNVPILKAGLFSPVKEPVRSVSTSFFNSKMIIWTAIIAIIALLGFMSVKLVKETNMSQK